MTKCESCRTVARDVYWAMALWDINEISPDTTRSTLQSTCANLGLRHSSWFKLDEICNDFIDDHIDDIASHVIVRNNHWDRVKRVATKGSSGEWVINAETTVIDNMCNKMSRYCTTPSVQAVPPGGWLKPATDSPPIRLEPTPTQPTTSTSTPKQEL